MTAVDCGDVETDEADHAASRDRIRTAVGTLLDRGVVPLLLGGDDSVPIPLLEAYAGRAPITILQIDAHIDWRDEVQGENLGLSSTMRRASEMPHVERIIQVGQRAIGSARVRDHADALAAGSVRLGPRPPRARRRAGAGADSGGLGDLRGVRRRRARPGHHARHHRTRSRRPDVLPGRRPPTGAAARGRIAGFDLVEFMAENDRGGIGALTAARLTTVMLGLVARQALSAA